MFPVPLFPVAHVGKVGRQRRSRGVLSAVLVAANLQLSSLNWLVGRPSDVAGVPSCDLHVDIRNRCVRQAWAHPPGESIASSEAALKQLLRGGSCYSTDAVDFTLVSFNPDLVSLPDDVSGSPVVWELNMS